MPDNLIITSGVGFGVLAAVFSGICYVYSHRFYGIRRRAREVLDKSRNQRECCVCGTHLRSQEQEQESELEHTAGNPCKECAQCHGLACHAGCGSRVRGAWVCHRCQAHAMATHRSFTHMLTSLQARMAKSLASPSSSTSKDASGSEVVQTAAEGDNEVVREFIERLVGAMLGTDVDDTSVDKTYGDPEYVALFASYHGDISSALSNLGLALHVYMANLPVSGHTPCTAYAGLKHIIRRVLRDASMMAILKDPQAQNPEVPEAASDKTYEDLLATAILNKVIDNYQHDLRRGSSGSSRRDSGSKRRRRGADERRIQPPADDTTSVSSVEEWCRSEASAGEKYVDHLSFSIQHSLNEITTSDDEYSSCNYLPSRTVLDSPEKDQNYLREDWQDNWLFSRKGKGSPKPVPVPMLVPNPSTDYRALIGDRDAEDTTDLSETGSDLEEVAELPHNIENILIDSRTVIGGKNLLENINPEYLEQTSERQEESVTNGDTGFEDEDVSEARNNILIHDTPSNGLDSKNITYKGIFLDEESDSLGSNTEKDMEYTEKYASMPRQISKDKIEISLDSSTTNVEVQQLEVTLSLEEEQDVSIENEPFEDATEDFVEEPIISIRGSYSEKEKQKWKNPVALPNNPYSKENLDKRLQNKSNSIAGNYAFGRDYYIREAKKAAGGRKKFLDELNTNLESSGHDSDDKSLPLSPENTDENIFTARPVILLDEDSDEKKESLSEIQSFSQSRPVSLDLSTDSEDVKRVYNLETGKVFMYKNNDITKEIIQSAKSPEGIDYTIKSNELISVDEVDSKFDENHNTTSENIEKEPSVSVSNIINALINENQSQQTFDSEPEKVIPPELKESSKKYLRSLSKNKNNLEVMSFSTPPISLQENDLKEQSSPTFDFNHFAGNTIEIEVENTEYNNHKSCIDLRLINEELLHASTNGFANSTPNLNDEHIFEERENEQKSQIIEELNTIPIPSVKDLKKIFDADKPTVTVSRSKSNLTTKPELRGHQVHSLTARSISKEFRRDILPELQKTADITINNNEVKGENDETPELFQTEEDELKAIPPCKSKIAFFEELKDNK